MRDLRMRLRTPFTSGTSAGGHEGPACPYDLANALPQWKHRILPPGPRTTVVLSGPGQPPPFPASKGTFDFFDSHHHHQSPPRTLCTHGRSATWPAEYTTLSGRRGGSMGCPETMCGAVGGVFTGLPTRVTRNCNYLRIDALYF